MVIMVVQPWATGGEDMHEYCAYSTEAEDSMSTGAHACSGAYILRSLVKG